MGRSCRNIARGVSLPIRYLGAPWPASVGSTVRRSRLNCLLRSGMFFFVGPVLLLFSMVAEWIMGNFFPMMAMGLYAVFWLSFGMLQLPTLQLGQSYATEADPTGVMAPEFQCYHRHLPRRVGLRSVHLLPLHSQDQLDLCHDLCRGYLGGLDIVWCLLQAFAG